MAPELDKQIRAAAVDVAKSGKRLLDSLDWAVYPGSAPNLHALAGALAGDVATFRSLLRQVPS